MVRSYMTGRTITPDYVKRTKVETIVSDSAMNQIVDDILNNLYPGKEAHGVIFIKDVSCLCNRNQRKRRSSTT
jgi:nitrogen regulatory protein PII